jgi:hypothetical protein
MSKIMEHNVETGEIILRDKTEAELAQDIKDQETNAKIAAAKAEAEAKRQAALDKLAALGLNTDDLKALGL